LYEGFQHNGAASGSGSFTKPDQTDNQGISLFTKAEDANCFQACESTHHCVYMFDLPEAVDVSKCSITLPMQFAPSDL
jgi:hypothetical protein